LYYAFIRYSFVCFLVMAGKSQGDSKVQQKQLQDRELVRKLWITADTSSVDEIFVCKINSENEEKGTCRVTYLGFNGQFLRPRNLVVGTIREARQLPVSS
jgi:hypothetical protein